jgi:hypothetical protein
MGPLDNSTSEIVVIIVDARHIIKILQPPNGLLNIKCNFLADI